MTASPESMDGAAGTIPGLAFRRLAGEAEAEVCATIMAESEPWLTLRRGREDCLGLLRDPGRETWVATLGEETVGFAVLVMHGAFVGYVQSLAVAPAWRSRGIGAELLRFVEARIFRDTPNVFMCVSSFNPRAMHLYHRLGYVMIGKLKDYIVPGHAEILLRKTIGPLSTFRRQGGRDREDPARPARRRNLDC